jgi:hypothetical protein
MKAFSFLALLLAFLFFANLDAMGQREPLPTCQDENGCLPDPPPPPSGPDCLSNSVLAGAMVARVPIGADGKYHVKYAFFDEVGNLTTPTAAIKKVYEDAFAEWNLKSETTRFEFEPAGSQDRSAVNIVGTPAREMNGGCVQTNAQSGFTYYGPDFATLASGNSSLAAAGIKHEIGHWLGMDHLSYSLGINSIMSAALPPCSNPTVITQTIQTGDAAKAKDCSAFARTLTQQLGEGGDDVTHPRIEYVSQTCYTIYDVYDIYYWNDGWHYYASVAKPVATFCE